MFPAVFAHLKRIASYDRRNRGRALPVDALPLSLMTPGMRAAFAAQVPLAELLEASGATLSIAVETDFG